MPYNLICTTFIFVFSLPGNGCRFWFGEYVHEQELRNPILQPLSALSPRSQGAKEPPIRATCHSSPFLQLVFFSATMIVAIWRVFFDPSGPIAACLPPTDTYNFCLSSAYFHGVQQSQDKKIATILLRRSLLSSLTQIYKHHNIAELGIYQYKVLTGNGTVLTGSTMIQVLMGKVWDQQDHPNDDVWASWDRRHRAMVTVGKSSWDGEIFRIADPDRTFTLQSTCNIQLLGAYVGEIQHPIWAHVTTLTRVIAGMHKVADSLGILKPSHMDFRDLAEDCNRQLYLLDHYHLRRVDIRYVSPQLRSYVQSKKTVLCSSIGFKQVLRKSQD